MCGRAPATLHDVLSRGSARWIPRHAGSGWRTGRSGRARCLHELRAEELSNIGPEGLRAELEPHPALLLDGGDDAAKLLHRLSPRIVDGQALRSRIERHAQRIFADRPEAHRRRTNVEPARGIEADLRDLLLPFPAIDF